ncbi:HD-GYP domain-containing protein [Cellulomonas sp. Leaf334]|uniref:HD-GYP domain-containing protein n=1 Tax=Cellulomonas sp. Leaf334 TaxID=1736339 RepID=UPI0006F34FE4|nr:HD-GYP domain-containing protein [Cellulomonas sp. Leaf334]KQR16463.1 hypothetical protein ASF78_03540 [Cellulomonas sp. Leaf334]
MAFGPTQNYDDVSLSVWKGRPILAGVVRALIVAVPVALSLGVGIAAVHWIPPARLGVNPWVWLLAELACATVVLVVATRLVRTLVPLTTLLRLTLYFPDRAPSRLAVAMSHYSPHVLHGRADRGGRTRGVPPDSEHATQILSLVAAISVHDPLTRGHSERVQAYSALIGTELGLSDEDAANLSWAALLHDIGKLRVPAGVLSKPGEPTASEWSVLAGHPEAGMEIAEPLRGWLGPWLDVIGQHHERWDGAGYPAGLAGTRISLGARIVAVADAYDVITSARSYKKPLPAAAARAELARCAGQQFDPQVVRAFLAIGLGSLRRVAGPMGLLSALPGLPISAADLPAAVQRLSTAGALQSAGAIGVVLSATIAGGALADGAAPPDLPPSDTSEVAVPRPEADASTAPVPVAVPTSPPDASSAPVPAAVPASPPDASSAPVPAAEPTSPPGLADEPLVAPSPARSGTAKPGPDPPAALPALPPVAAPSPDDADGVNRTTGRGSTNGGAGVDGNRGTGSPNG